MTAQLCYFLGDFTENYRFVIQDEVQGFHWNNFQCTLHPVVTYYQENDELKNISYCIISLFILLMGVLDSTENQKNFNNLCQRPKVILD